MEEKPRNPRRWFQYSLRTLLILTTVCAALFAYWSHKARQQRTAVAVLKNAQLFVLYDFQIDNLKSPPYWPSWLVDNLGVDYFANAHSASTWKTSMTDVDLQCFKDIPAIKEITLWYAPNITDAGLEHFEGLNHLRKLVICGSTITDTGLNRLQQALPKCKIERKF